MKRALTFLIISAPFLILYGCNNRDGVFIGKKKYGLKFQQEIKIPLTTPIQELPTGSSIQIIDTFLLVQHQEEDPVYYWDVYNLNTLKPLKSILRRGRGPKEVLFAHYVGQYETINDHTLMYFLDINSSRFLRINLDESIRHNDDVIELVSAIDPDKSPYFITDNNVFIYCNNNPNNGSRSLMTGDHSWKNPTMKKEYIGPVASEDVQKLTHSLYYNKKNNKACAIPFYINHIQIIDLKGNDDLLLSTGTNNHWQTVSNNDISGLTTIFYSTTRTTDEFIFALYQKRAIAEMENTPEQTEIHIFDWNGNALARIILQDSINSFAVDVKNKMLYGLNNQSNLYRYDISACLHSPF